MVNRLFAPVGMKKIENKAVAVVNLNNPIVSGPADVNFTNTGTAAISESVIAASMPTLKFTEFWNKFYLYAVKIIEIEQGFNVLYLIYTKHPIRAI